MDFKNLYQNLIPWFLAHGLKVILILFSAWLINRSSKIFLERTIDRQIDHKISVSEKRQKVKTLIGVLGGTFKFIIWILALLMILPEFGINIAAILAGIGVVGLAIGMAARDIISDFISGLFIILEGQYNIGDTVKIGGLEGEIKEISLRRTIIQDKTGFLHSIPNGQIKIVSKKIK